jgi:hypothetical protein
MPIYSFSSRSKTSTFSALCQQLTPMLRGRWLPYCQPCLATSPMSRKLAGVGRLGESVAGLALGHRQVHLVHAVVEEWHCIRRHILYCRVSRVPLLDIDICTASPIDDEGRAGASTASSGCPGSCSERCSMALKLGAAFGGAPAGPPWG